MGYCSLLIVKREDIMTKSKVLVVDDEAEVRKLFGDFLEHRGYRVLMAKEGAEALRILREESPELVLLDIRMPEMDGLEVLSRIKAMRPETAVVMISGYATLEIAKESLEKGAYDYISKPVELGHLEDLILMIEASKSMNNEE